MRKVQSKVVIQLIILIASGILLMRLFYIQIIDKKFVSSANSNALRQITIFPSRGIIYDRNQQIIVENQAIYDLMIIPSQVKSFDTSAFCNLTKIPRPSFEVKLAKAKKYSRYKASVFEKQISWVTYAQFQERLNEFPGFYVVPRTVREYPHRIGAHVLGYIGEVDEEIVNNPNSYYKSGDYIGISGIERSYETELRGKKGVKNILVDVHSREMGSYENGEFDTDAVSGVDLTSTLDLTLQLYGEMLLKNKKGSIVAIEPSTGEILALVSSPNYDPNLLVGKERGLNYRHLLNEPTKPMFNRAIMAEYPPGSIFKLAMALVGEKHQVIHESEFYHCRGFYSNGSNVVKCRPHPNPVNLQSAIQFSCNAYFCQTLKGIIDNPNLKNSEEGYRMWRGDMDTLGFGRLTNIDVSGEKDGNLPSVAYYDRLYGSGRWKASTIISLGIGQGELGITPIQMANFMAIIANRGYYISPHLIRKSKASEAQKIHVPIDSSLFGPVIEGMYQVVKAGTAGWVKLPGIDICGKTGTVQNPHGEDHAVFVCFAPMDNPKIAIAVVIENSGGGSTWAAPTASLMIEKYLTDTIQRQWMEDRVANASFIKEEKPTVIKRSALSDSLLSR